MDPFSCRKTPEIAFEFIDKAECGRSPVD